MTLGSMKKLVRQSWDAIPMPGTVIARMNTFGHGQPNDVYFLNRKKHPIGELDITGVYYGGTESPHIVLMEPETDLDPISSGVETLPEI